MTSTKKTRGVLINLGEDGRELIKLRMDGTIFGREKADIILSDSEVSSTHFQIQNIDGSYHLFDMNSSNGTFLNNQKIVKGTLKEGDVIRAGKTSFRFILKEEQTVRHIPTLFQSSQISKSHNSIVDTMIEGELGGGETPTFVIKVTYPSQKSEIIEIFENETFIGRASSFGSFDQDPEISRRHLKIKLNDSGEIFIEDQGSTNGSYLNGEKIKGIHRVDTGDTVKVGGCLLRIKATK